MQLHETWNQPNHLPCHSCTLSYIRPLTLLFPYSLPTTLPPSLPPSTTLLPLQSPPLHCHHYHGHHPLLYVHHCYHHPCLPLFFSLLALLLELLSCLFDYCCHHHCQPSWSPSPLLPTLPPPPLTLPPPLLYQHCILYRSKPQKIWFSMVVINGGKCPFRKERNSSNFTLSRMKSRRNS